MRGLLAAHYQRRDAASSPIAQRPGRPSDATDAHHLDGTAVSRPQSKWSRKSLEVRSAS